MTMFLGLLSGLRPNRMASVLGIVFATLVVLGSPDVAMAHCCGNYLIGSDGCNIFGCNCSGPCTNFGHSCPPVSYDGACGSCAGYDTCATSSGKCGYCVDPLYCCQDDTVCCASSAGAPAASQSKPTASTEVPATEKVAPPGDRFKAIDTDKSGGISLPEATKWVKANKPELSAADLKKGFDALDKNMNGTIEPGEFDRDLK